MTPLASWRRIAALLAPLALTGIAGTAQASVVQCYDEARGVIQAKLESQCKDRIVSDAEAKRIKAQLRRERILRAKQPKPEHHKGRRGHGTGFFVTADGKVVTNHHVIEKCKETIWIDTTDGQTGTAKILATDKGNDLALLASTLKAPKTAVFRKPVDDLAAGGRLTMIGYGTITLAPIKPHLTPGTFEKANRNNTRFRMSAAVRPGNSGGPVLDDSGYVVGVVFAQQNTPETFKQTGRLVLDRGYAITNPMVFRFLQRNDVAFQSAPPREARDRKTILREAKPIIARVTCRH